MELCGHTPGCNAYSNTSAATNGRRNGCTLLIDLGASPATVQAQLGHSDPRITLSAYSHTVDKSQREAVERLAEILIPKDAKTAEAGTVGKWIQ
jgi:integrase